MSNFDAIIFDLDGTLIHSAPDLQAAVNVALKSRGRGPLDLPTITSFIGNGVEKLVARSLKATGGSDEGLHAEVLADFLEAYAQNMTTLTRPYDGVVEVLEQCRAAGVPLGICTNKPTQPAKNICQELGIAELFDTIVGSQPGQAKKPDPQPLLACIAAMGVAREHTLYVGDSAIDYETAVNAGMAFRLFSGGYLNHDLPDLADEDRFDHWQMDALASRD